jgi:small subunit ribosomal protein S4e
MGGVFAPRPRPGPHKKLECIPLVLILRNKLKYALNYTEAGMILKQRLVKVDDRIRTDTKFPCGFMDVVSIPKTNDAFRVLYDTKGRFVLVRIKDANNSERDFKLAKVLKKKVGMGGIPYIVTHDGRTIRYPDPNINESDTVSINFKSGEVTEFYRFKAGNVAMVTGGANTGRVGEILDVEKHQGSFDIVHLKDANGQKISTRKGNVFVIGQGLDAAVKLPKLQGIARDTVTEREKKIVEYQERKAGKTTKKSRK